MKKRILLLLIFMGALYLLPICFRPLMAPDEFRYAEIPREMLETGDFITPRLLSCRYFEKPPMGYWLTASSFRIFGLNVFALRIVPVLGALLSAALLGWWCLRRKLPREAAVDVAFLYLACGMVWIVGTFATLDSLFCMWITATLVFFSVAMESDVPREKWGCLAAAGVALGCGFLTKGFLAYALPGLAVAGYLIWQKRWKDIITLPWLPLGVSLLVIAPWAAAIHRAEPDFWNYFVIHEHFRRFTDSAEGQHEAPFWLLLPFLAGGIFPAFFPVVTSAFTTRKEAWKKLWTGPDMRFALCALLLPLIFLSCSDGKLPTYVLPCFAPAAMAGILILSAADPEKTPSALKKLTVVCSVIVIIAGSLILLSEVFYLLWGTGFVPVLPLGVALWLPLATTLTLGAVAAGTFLFISRRRKQPEPAWGFMLYALPVLFGVWFFPGFTASFKMPEFELLDLASQTARRTAARPQVFTTSKLMQAAAWCYRDSHILLLNSLGEMEYGHKAAVKHGEKPLMHTHAEVWKMLCSPGRKRDVLIVLIEEDLEKHRRFLPPGGEKLSTSGEVCALYYPSPGKKEGRN